MILKFKYMTAILFSIMVGGAYSNTLLSVKTKDFNIYGVKLGMNAQEAMTSMIDNLKISKEQLAIDDSKGSTELITYSKNLHDITVTLDHADAEKEPLVISIIYKRPWSQSNIQQLKEYAIKKYGTPSNFDGRSYEWCSNPKYIRKGIKMACGHLKIETAMILNNNKLSLIDHLRKKKILEQYNKTHKTKKAW